jgi:hypothetical protein
VGEGGDWRKGANQAMKWCCPAVDERIGNLAYDKVI